MTRLPQSVLWDLRDDRTLGKYAKLAYLMLWTRLPDARPSMAKLAADMGVSVRTARDAVRELERAGILKTLPRVSEQGDADTNRYELTGILGAATGAEPPGATCRTGAAAGAAKDSNPKNESEGRKSRAAWLARPAVSRASDQIELVRQAVAMAGWDIREVEDEDALDVWARFVTDRKTAVPLADPVKYLAGIFASFVSLDGVLSNTPERD